MPLHAVKLLGMLSDPRALPQLVNVLILAYEVEDDWIMEFLAFAAGSILDIGDPSSIPVLEKAFDRGVIDEFIINRDDLLIDIKKLPGIYNNDLLNFYNPEKVAERQVRREIEYEKKYEKEYEKERHAAQKLEQREKSIAIELKRL